MDDTMDDVTFCEVCDVAAADGLNRDGICADCCLAHAYDLLDAGYFGGAIYFLTEARALMGR